MCIYTYINRVSGIAGFVANQLHTNQRSIVDKPPGILQGEAPHDGGWKRMQKDKENDKEIMRNLVEFQENPVNAEELP